MQPTSCVSPAVTEAAALAGSTTPPSVSASPDNWLAGIEAWQKIKKADLDRTLQNAIAAAGRVRDTADTTAQTTYWTSEVGAKNAKRTSETASDITFWQARENVRYAAHSQIHASLGTSWSGYLKDSATARLAAFTSLTGLYTSLTAQRNASELVYQATINTAYTARETTLADLRRDDAKSQSQRDSRKATDLALSEESFLRTIGTPTRVFADLLADNASASDATYKAAHAAAYKDFYKAQALTTKNSELSRVDREQTTLKSKSSSEEAYREIDSAAYKDSVYAWTANDEIFKNAEANALAQAAQNQFGSGTSPWGTYEAQYLALQVSITTSTAAARKQIDRDQALAQFNSEKDAAQTQKSDEQTTVNNSDNFANSLILSTYDSDLLYADTFTNNSSYRVAKPVLSMSATDAYDYAIEEVLLEKFYAFLKIPTEEAGMPESEWMFKDGRYMGINQPAWAGVQQASFDSTTGANLHTIPFKANSAFDETTTLIWLVQEHNDSGLDVNLINPTKLYLREDLIDTSDAFEIAHLNEGKDPGQSAEGTIVVRAPWGLPPKDTLARSPTSSGRERQQFASQVAASANSGGNGNSQGSGNSSSNSSDESTEQESAEVTDGKKYDLEEVFKILEVMSPSLHSFAYRFVTVRNAASRPEWQRRQPIEFVQSDGAIDMEPGEFESLAAELRGETIDPLAKNSPLLVPSSDNAVFVDVFNSESNLEVAVHIFNDLKALQSAKDRRLHEVEFPDDELQVFLELSETSTDKLLESLSSEEIQEALDVEALRKMQEKQDDAFMQFRHETSNMVYLSPQQLAALEENGLVESMTKVIDRLDKSGWLKRETPIDWRALRLAPESLKLVHLRDRFYIYHQVSQRSSNGTNQIRYWKLIDALNGGTEVDPSIPDANLNGVLDIGSDPMIYQLVRDQRTFIETGAFNRHERPDHTLETAEVIVDTAASVLVPGYEAVQQFSKGNVGWGLLALGFDAASVLPPVALLRFAKFARVAKIGEKIGEGAVATASIARASIRLASKVTELQLVKRASVLIAKGAEQAAPYAAKSEKFLAEKANQSYDLLIAAYKKVFDKTEGLVDDVANGADELAPVKTVDMMAETGQLGGKLYGSEKLGKLQRYLERRGIAMDPARNGSFDGVKGIMELPPNATVLNVRHELSHMLDFKKYGPDYYKKFNSFDREEMVLDRLTNNRVWNNLNEGEKSWSLLYPFTRKGGQAW